MAQHCRLCCAGAAVLQRRGLHSRDCVALETARCGVLDLTPPNARHGTRVCHRTGSEERRDDVEGRGTKCCERLDGPSDSPGSTWSSSALVPAVLGVASRSVSELHRPGY